MVVIEEVAADEKDPEIETNDDVSKDGGLLYVILAMLMEIIINHFSFHGHNISIGARIRNH